MKNKMLKIIIIIAVIAVIICILMIVKNKTTKPIQYEPQEEISGEQERKTIISLYFVNKKTKEVAPEARMIDVKDLINEPYNVLINFLIEGPKNENFEKTNKTFTNCFDGYPRRRCSDSRDSFFILTF